MHGTHAAESVAPPSPTALTRDEVNRLFDEVREHMRKQLPKPTDPWSEFNIFLNVYGEGEKVHQVWLAFLHDVPSCPAEVIEECRRLLAPSVRARS